eukprot:CAMPEP_0197840080 /NCGR_PEP_ID=MMETSP1437-20131217/45396_1 /TAXON_ID=49252 ORGANISM="Eucampia antarctica, Strain CCMP1452" /NCGR_SAMPLE_ID=MMETSP1437 /ASSEMBLY_ACC=CAM_ASM_001096 /LENGTH=964 /DNA_ID=CAMNT_0043449631 /DNA_START=77 /DNA_END=2972 /DNA_ORIENTATION=-
MTADSGKFRLRISRFWVLATIALTASTAFFTGCAFRVLIVDSNMVTTSSDNMSTDTGGIIEATASGRQIKMPPPMLDSAKSMPDTIFTEKRYTVDRAVRNSHHLHIVPSAGKQCAAEDGSCESAEEALASSSSEDSSDKDSIEDTATEDEHLPAGQHLLVDIKNVDARFLDSEERLAQSMVDIISTSKLTMLSYHCHSLLPAGVSCVGVLLESHISFHTWPSEGVITLDLFTCGSGLLIPLIPLVESFFAIPRPNAGKYIPGPDVDMEKYTPREEDLIEMPKTVWKHTLRGFRPSLGWATYRPLESDVGDLAGSFDTHYKKEIAAIQTPFQLINIWDSIESNHPGDMSVEQYERSLRTEIETYESLHPQHYDPGDMSVEQYERSLRTEIETYESLHPQHYAPGRTVFLEGVLQSTHFGDEAYHEAMVQPAMFAHDNPQRVAIIGGGEGATLREVLKHNSVTHVKMIEIDELMVKTSIEYLPSWSDCSDILGCAQNCFDDERAEILFEDAFAWFLENGLDYLDKTVHDDSGEDSDDNDSSQDEPETAKELFDVIIMDALDPQEMVEFAATLYNNDDFAKSLFNSLDEDGVLVLQMGSSPEHSDPAELNTIDFRRHQIMDLIELVGFGSSPEHSDPAELNTIDFRRHQIMDLIELVGFKTVQVYEEAHCFFGDPWSFMVACKDIACRDNWFLNEAGIALESHRRMRPTLSGLPQLKYFDGATMKGYQQPTKQWESAFCKRTPKPASCQFANGYDKKRKDIPIDQFEVRISNYGDHAGRGVFAKVEVPKDAYIGLETAVKRIYVEFQAMQFIESYFQSALSKNTPELEKLLNYIYGYGYSSIEKALQPEYYVDSGIITFVNHGCNSTENIINPLNQEGFNEWTKMLDEGKITEQPYFPPFDPSYDRHIHHLSASLDITKRKITAGEEILSNYVGLGNNDLEEHSRIDSMCKGEKLGKIKVLEMSKEQ